MRLLALLTVLLLQSRTVLAEPPRSWQSEFRPFATSEYLATGLLLSWAMVAKFGLPNPGPIIVEPRPFELDVTRALAPRSEKRKNTIQYLTDASLVFGLALPLADSLVAGLAHGDWELSAQMALIGVEAVSGFLAVLWTVQAATGRVRPHVRLCDADPSAPSWVCNINEAERNRSLIAGHTASAWLGAGLTCTVHGKVPLYGNAFADYATCGVMVANAVLNGVGRIAAGAHYLSDVLLGTILGITTGFLLPAALHYGFGPYDRSLGFAEAITVAPNVGEGVGLSVAGMF